VVALLKISTVRIVKKEKKQCEKNDFNKNHQFHFIGAKNFLKADCSFFSFAMWIEKI
jgi:hypothetical protein